MASIRKAILLNGRIIEDNFTRFSKISSFTTCCKHERISIKIYVFI